MEDNRMVSFSLGGIGSTAEDLSAGTGECSRNG